MDYAYKKLTEGEAHIRKQDYVAAVAVLTESIKANPTAQAHRYRGLAFSRLGRTAEATTDYQMEINGVKMFSRFST